MFGENLECLVCGEVQDAPEGTSWSEIADWQGEHEHADAVVVIRDGWRGQYLAPTLALDVNGLVPGSVPVDVQASAERWLDAMGSLRETATETDVERVMDWVTDHADSILDDHGFVMDSEDGYVIYKRTTETEGSDKDA